MIDGKTPLSLFQEHLKSYDIEALASELLAKNLIMHSERSSGSVGRSRPWSLGKLFRRESKGADAETRDTSQRSAEPTLHDSHQPPMEEAETTESGDPVADDSDLTQRYLKQYAPSLQDDDDVTQSLSNHKGKRSSS